MLLALLLLHACGADTSGADTSAADTAGPGDDAHPAWCDTAVEVGWDDFGHGFLLTHCQGCHASTAPERYGAPEGVVFDTEQDAVEQADAILRVVIEARTMPPAGGVTEDEELLLQTWLLCGY